MKKEQNVPLFCYIMLAGIFGGLWLHSWNAFLFLIYILGFVLKLSNALVTSLHTPKECPCQQQIHP